MIYKNSSAFGALLNHKPEHVEIIDYKSPVDLDLADSLLVFDEHTGFYSDAIHDLCQGDESALSAANLKKMNGTYPPRGLSVDEIIQLGTPRGIDTLVERERYLNYLNDQIEIVSDSPDSKTDSEPSQDAKTDPVPSPDSAPSK